MLSFDMPLERLKTYMGSSPCPDDIDFFWNRAIEEMHALGTDCRLTPAAVQFPNAECFDLTFTGVGGAVIHAKYLRPAKMTAPAPATLLFHGYANDSGCWSGKLGYVAMGFAVAALDCRGQAGLSEDSGGILQTTIRGHIIRGLGGDPEKLLYRAIFLDAAQLARIIMSLPEIDERRVAAAGASQGGALAVCCAALEPNICLAAPTHPFLSDYRRVWDMELANHTYNELTYYFRNFDPRHERETEIFHKLGYIDIQNLAKRVKAKVLWSTGLMDTVCPPSSQFAAYNKITSEKSMLIYPDFAHEPLRNNEDDVMAFISQLVH